MARLKLTSSDSDDDYTNDSELPRCRPLQLQESGTRPLRCSPRKKAVRSYGEDFEGENEDPKLEAQLRPKTTPMTESRKQIRLAPFRLGNTLRSLPLEPLRAQKAKQSTGKPAKPTFLPTAETKIVTGVKSTPVSALTEDGIGSIEQKFEESIYCESAVNDTDSDDELPSPRRLLSFRQGLRQMRANNSDGSQLNGFALVAQIDEWKISESNEDLASIRPIERKTQRKGTFSTTSFSEDVSDDAAFLHFSPPRLHSPSKNCPPARPLTPPRSPTKSKLQSPSKTKTRVPSPALRSSLDAFWDVGTINEWNDQYSPRKVLKSPKKGRIIQESTLSVPSSPSSRAQSPTKRDRAQRAAKKTFDADKHALAERFLVELDAKITQNQIQALAASTGGVRIVWSKTLNSTAGRANWRRETSKSQRTDGTIVTTHKHHTFIELAEKVIDDECRLLNVVAHEFCHLANFMISGVKNQPHGRQFQEWGRKCTRAFADRGVEVTTKHSYRIDYKYIWQCSNEDCGAEFKRHSKSIDPQRHTCGSCRSKLMQIKPAPRMGAGAGTGYAAWVKDHFAEVKKSMPGATHKEIMEALGRTYREHKATCNEERAGPALVEYEGDEDPPCEQQGAEADMEKLVAAIQVVALVDG